MVTSSALVYGCSCEAEDVQSQLAGLARLTKMRPRVKLKAKPEPSSCGVPAFGMPALEKMPRVESTLEDIFLVHHLQL